MRDAFSPARDVHQDAAWEALRDYSFVLNKASEPGWLRLHSRMSNALGHRLDDQPEAFRRSHTLASLLATPREKRHRRFCRPLLVSRVLLDPDRAIRTWERQGQASAFRGRDDAPF